METQRPLSPSLPPESLQRLLEISARLSSTLHLENLLALVMEVATELTNTETASILLVEHKNQQLRFAASTGETLSPHIAIPLDSSIAGWVVRHGRSLVISDVQSDTRFFSGVDEEIAFQTRDMLAVPLITTKEVIGCLEVINKKGGVAYTEQDIALMEALASQSAVAILNAHLFHQSDLLAEIMHELKTPLMAIHTASELLCRPDFPAEKQASVIEMIRRESARLSQMTKAFVDFARLESGRMQFARRPIDVRVLLEEVLALTQAAAAARQVTLRSEIDPDIPPPGASPCLVGDVDRLKQILLNLVSNGVKYNRENGRLTIHARCQENQLLLSVADTGHGIAPDDLPHLFERFYRIPGQDGQIEGSGLGLAISKKLVEEHGGQIAVRSQVGSGTEFTVQLPLC